MSSQRFDLGVGENNDFPAGPAFGRGEGGVGFDERKAVGDFTGELVAEGLVLFEKANGAIHMAGFEAPAADDAELLAGDDVGVEFNVAGVGVLAEDEELAAVAHQFDALVDRFGMADAFDRLIRPVGAEQFKYLCAAGGDIGKFGDIDDVACTEGEGEIEAVTGASDGDDLGGSGGFGDGDGGQSNGAGALDEDGVAPFDGGAFHAVDGGGEGAAGTDEGEAGDGVGDAEDGGAGAQKNFFGIAAAEVGGVGSAIGDAVGFAGEAAGRLVLDAAVITFAADDGGGPGDAVADLEGGAAPVFD